MSYNKSTLLKCAYRAKILIPWLCRVDVRYVAHNSRVVFDDTKLGVTPAEDAAWKERAGFTSPSGSSGGRQEGLGGGRGGVEC